MSVWLSVWQFHKRITVLNFTTFSFTDSNFIDLILVFFNSIFIFRTFSSSSRSSAFSKKIWRANFSARWLRRCWRATAAASSTATSRTRTWLWTWPPASSSSSILDPGQSSRMNHTLILTVGFFATWTNEFFDSYTYHNVKSVFYTLKKILIFL